MCIHRSKNWYLGKSTPHPSGQGPILIHIPRGFAPRDWIGIVTWPSGYWCGFSKVPILRSMDSSTLAPDAETLPLQIQTKLSMMKSGCNWQKKS